MELLPEEFRSSKEIMECEAVWTGNAYQKLFNYQGDYPAKYITIAQVLSALDAKKNLP